MSSARWQGCLCGMLVAVAGCWGPPRVPAPALDPASLAAQAIQRYDANRDAKLTAAEFSPGLQALCKTADADEDGVLTQDEIVQRIEEIVAGRVGLQDFGGRITLDGRPLVGAEVRLIPDPILEGVVQPASGTTDEDGFVLLQISERDAPGVQPGFYRLEVSHIQGGQERIPARYNSATELGEEVGPFVSQGGWKLDLTSG